MISYFENGKRIINQLEANGFQAFFVGGFVRDHLLGIEANDIDITTDALPKQIEAVFENTKATGKRYGTISVFLDDHKFEVTTFRADIEYIDYRHPERVVFSKVLDEDLKRRDFTINALAMDSEENITDLFNGRADIKNRTIKAIGDPYIRFNEDALRMLRAFRFVSKLGFDIEAQTLESIKKNIVLLKEISNERIIAEFKEIFRYDNYHKALKLLNQVDIGKAFPELEKGIARLAEASDYQLDCVQFFTLCLYLAECEIPDYWRFSNREADMINDIRIALYDIIEFGVTKMMIYTYGLDTMINANRIDVILGRSDNLEEVIHKLYNDLPIKRLADLEIDGNDVREMLQGRNPQLIGSVLRRMTEAVVNGELENDHSKLKAYATQLLERENEG